jgi:thioredoxin 1
MDGDAKREPASSWKADARTKGEILMNANLKQFTDANFEEVVLRQPRSVLVDFWAPWCGPCVALGPVIDELAQAQSGTVSVGKLNVDDNPLTARRFDISSIPTVMIFRAGAVVHRVVGIKPREHYEALLQSAAA